MIVYISGGVRSGKSRYAQERARQLSDAPVYVATARIWDDEFGQRVDRHRAERGPEWTTFEQEADLATLPLTNRVAVIDCVTLWLTNLFMAHDSDVARTLTSFNAEVEALAKLPGTFLIISNEIGMGLHADTELGRAFTDLQGWANQYVAAVADEAIFMVSGLPLFFKNT